jgi:hypothetical protein
MSEYVLKPRALPLDDSWDVIVVGGGPAGCTAAAAAAREGAKTLLIEAMGALGGMGTSALVPAWCPFSDKIKIIYGGLAETVFTECKEKMAHVSGGDMDWVAIDHELLKRIYDDLVTDAGASVLFHTVLSTVDVNDSGEVQALIVSNKNGLTALKAKVYVDCTGDADVAAWAGAEFQKGDPDTGDLQPATHCFVLSNVDDYHYRYGQQLHPANPNSPIHQISADPKYDLILDGHACNNLVGPGTVGFNAGHIWGVDNTDPLSLSKALMYGRRQAAQFRDALAEYHPKAYSGSFLVNTGSLLGIRETRRIIGDYLLTREDYLDRKSFADEIGRNSYYIDVHGSKKEATSKRGGSMEDEKRCARYAPGESHGIPYRCLTPKGLPNVLVAGRAVSCDRMIQGSVRVMPVCLVMGEAAGLAAAMAAQETNGDTHAVDTADLRARLKAHGAYLPDVEQA